MLLRSIAIAVIGRWCLVLDLRAAIRTAHPDGASGKDAPFDGVRRSLTPPHSGESDRRRSLVRMDND
jgi:hypothetical protein